MPNGQGSGVGVGGILGTSEQGVSMVQEISLSQDSALGIGIEQIDLAPVTDIIQSSFKLASFQKATAFFIFQFLGRYVASKGIPAILGHIVEGHPEFLIPGLLVPILAKGPKTGIGEGGIETFR